MRAELAVGAPARTWVGLWPPPEVVEVLEALPRPAIPGVRWTTADQWHVTLAFLGTIDPDEVAAALGGLDHPAIEVALGPRVERLGRQQVVIPAAGATSLAAAVGDALERFVAERRAFVGHLTLARLKGAARCPLLGAPIDLSWRADRVVVVTTELHPQGARYTTHAEQPLRSAR